MTAMTSKTWSTRRVLTDRDAGLYLAAVVVSGLGSSAMGLVAGIWVKDLTGSDALAALCTFALWAPLLAGPLLGALADRPRRRALLPELSRAQPRQATAFCRASSRARSLRFRAWGLDKWRRMRRRMTSKCSSARDDDSVS